MRFPHSSLKPHRSPSFFFLILSFLVLLVMGGVMAGCKKQTPLPTSTPFVPTVTPTVVPTATPQTLPPALVETDPLPGAQIALKNPITFYFNQPMQRASVEGAISGEPALSGRFAWRDDATLTFTPDSALLPDTQLMINIASTAQSSKGMALQQPISLSFNTTSSL